VSIDANDHMAILALYAEYNRSIDAGDVVGWLATFMEDAIFHHPARIYTGQSELREFITTRSAQLGTGAVNNMIHWNDPIVLSRVADSVAASCRLVVTGTVRETGKLTVVAQGRYRDSLIRTENGWYFRERRLSIV
jgi:ketosteroid isomerase-like protein